MKNFELFRDMIKVQKIMSPPFAAGDCSLRISVYQSPVNNSEHLSLCLESKVSTACIQHRQPSCMFHPSRQYAILHMEFPVSVGCTVASAPLAWHSGTLLDGAFLTWNCSSSSSW